MVFCVYTEEEKRCLLTRAHDKGYATVEVAGLCGWPQRLRVLPNGFYQAFDDSLKTGNQFDAKMMLTLADFLALVAMSGQRVIPENVEPEDLEELALGFSFVVCTFGRVATPGESCYCMPMTFRHYSSYLSLVSDVFAVHGWKFCQPPGLMQFMVSVDSEYYDVDLLRKVRTVMEVPLRLAVPVVQDGDRDKNEEIDWLGLTPNPVILGVSGIKPLDGYKLETVSAVAGVFSPTCAMFQVPRLTSSVFSKADALLPENTCLDIVKGLSGMTSQGQVDVEWTRVVLGSGITDELRQEVVRVLNPQPGESPEIGFSGAFNGVLHAAEFKGRVVAVLGKRKWPHYLNFPGVRIDSDNPQLAVKGVVIRGVPRTLSEALAEMIGPEEHTHDLIWCEGETENEGLMRGKANDLMAFCQAAWALRHVKLGGSVVVRIVGKLVGQPLLFEFMALVVPWFDLFYVVRPHMRSLLTEGYLVLKRYRGPQFGLDHFRANFETVLARFDAASMCVFRALIAVASYNLVCSGGRTSDLPPVRGRQLGPLMLCLFGASRVVTKRSVIRMVDYPERSVLIFPESKLLELSQDRGLAWARGLANMPGLPYFDDWMQGSEIVEATYRAKIHSVNFPVAAIAKQIGKLVNSPGVGLDFFKAVYSHDVSTHRLDDWDVIDPVDESVARLMERFVVEKPEDGHPEKSIIRELGLQVSPERAASVLMRRFRFVSPGLWERRESTVQVRDTVKPKYSLPGYLLRGGRPPPRFKEGSVLCTGKEAKRIVEDFVNNFERYFRIDDAFEGLFFTGCFVASDEMKTIIAGMSNVVLATVDTYEVIHVWPRREPAFPNPVLRIGNVRSPLREKKPLVYNEACLSGRVSDP